MGSTARHFFAACLLAATCASAQVDVKQVTIGVAFYYVPLQETRGPEPASPYARALVQGLREKGWVDGRNVRIVWRTAAEHPRGVAGVVDELVGIPIDILVASGNDFAIEAKRVAPALRVVLASSDFPVESGIIASLARPGGNITGLSNWVGLSLNAKRLALLKEADPRVRRVAFIAPPGIRALSPELQRAADTLGVAPILVGVDRLEELEGALGKALALQADGLFVADYPFAFVKANQLRLGELAARHRIAAIHSASTAAEHGALLTYGPDIAENYRRSAAFVDKILRGAKPGDIPFEEPAKLELVVNLKAARAIGLTLPPSILTQAGRVID